MTDSEDSPLEPPSPRRFQFSLRAQMVAVTTVAVVLGLLVVLGQTVGWMLFYAIVYCLLPTPLVIGALFGRGELRTFAIGALVPWIVMGRQPLPVYPTLRSAGSSPAQAVAWMVGSTFFMVIVGAGCGVLAVATRRWIERSGWKG
jgi:hypothetical protein